MPSKSDLQSYLELTADAGLAETISAIASVSTALAGRIAAGQLAGELGTLIGENTDGDHQKVLDVEAHDAFIEGLSAAPVRWIASEECDQVIEANPAGRFAVAVDPLDGSSNIDVNISVGTIFSITDAKPGGEASFLRPGREQLAAGFVVYGPQTILILSFGKGVQKFILDPQSQRFVLLSDALMIPATATEFAINSSNYRHWSSPIRAYIDDCLAGDTGPRGKNFNMRWVASLVAEAFRIMSRGGVFLYPGDARPGYANGRLRMVYECAPIAFVIEQAGGQATDGCDPILDQVPTSLHDRSPLVFGSTDKVARVAAYHDLPAAEVSPLFGKRGLFSA